MPHRPQSQQTSIYTTQIYINPCVCGEAIVYCVFFLTATCALNPTFTARAELVKSSDRCTCRECVRMPHQHNAIPCAITFNVVRDEFLYLIQLGTIDPDKGSDQSSDKAHNDDNGE